MDFFISRAKMPYNSKNFDDRDSGMRIRTSIFEKVSHWGREVGSIVGMKVQTSNRWLMNYRPVFTTYAWCRIFPDPNDVQSFFNVEANTVSKTLVIKMHCKFSGKHQLNSNKVKVFESYARKKLYNGQPLIWHEIKLDRFNNFQDLIRFSIQFINENLDHFNEIQNRIRDENVEAAALVDRLERIDPESVQLSHVPYVPEIEMDINALNEPPTFYGNDDHGRMMVEEPPIDYISRNIENKKIGDFGEQLILRHEQRKVDEWISQGKLHSGTRAVKQSDRAGYDILSFDEDGSERHIEVKTTIGDKNTPFYMSHNENLRMRQDPQWKLYRVHDILLDSNQASFFIWCKEEVVLYVEFLVQSYHCRLKLENRKQLQKLN